MIALFVVGCALGAASSVSRDQPSPDVLDNITSLINKSLVRQTESDGEPRQGMLEAIREFDLKQLARTNELETVQRAHTAQLDFAQSSGITEGLSERDDKRTRNF